MATAWPMPALSEGPTQKGSDGLVVVEDLVVAYGRIRAVDGVSLVVPESGCTALLGPNGAGKTTLMRAITGLAQPRGGRVRFDGRDITGLRPSRIARLGVAHVQQGRAIFPQLTVDENLRAVSARLEQADVSTVFQYFPVLADRGRQVAGTLSGGQQQMLALGLALLTRPRLLVVDEPSLGLAPRVVREIYDVFRELREQGVSLIIVEQFVHMLLGLADHVYLLQKGTVAFSGSTEALAKGPEGASEIMGLYLGTPEAASAGAPARAPDDGGIVAPAPSEDDRVGRALTWMHRIEERARSGGETAEELLARTVGLDSATAVTADYGQEIGRYEVLDEGWAVCATCGHRFRPILVRRSNCPRCRIPFAADQLGDSGGPLTEWWSRQLRNPMFVLLVVAAIAFSQFLVLLLLIAATD